MITLQELTKKVCDVYKIKPVILTSNSRIRTNVKYRIHFTYLAKTLGFSISEIARFLGRDHTTVMYYLKQDFAKWGDIPQELEDFIQPKESSSAKPTVEAQPKKPKAKMGKVSKYNYVFKRANYTCEIPTCDFDEVLEVHHIIPRRLGGKDDVDNLIVLCPTHHGMADRGMLYVKGKLSDSQ